MQQHKRRVPQALPQTGKLRWSQLEPFMPISRETWRKLSLEGKAPPSIRFSVRCTMWDASEVHRWLADPMAYTYPAGASRTPEPQA